MSHLVSPHPIPLGRFPRAPALPYEPSGAKVTAIAAATDFEGGDSILPTDLSVLVRRYGRSVPNEISLHVASYPMNEISRSTRKPERSRFSVRQWHALTLEPSGSNRTMDSSGEQDT